MIITDNIRLTVEELSIICLGAKSLGISSSELNQMVASSGGSFKKLYSKVYGYKEMR